MAIYPSYSFFDFNSVMQQWQSIGLFEIILPIILIFTIVFAILQRTKILGGIKGTDTIVALVIGFFGISNPQVTAFFIPLFSHAAMGIAIILVFLLAMALIMPKMPSSWGDITLIGGIAIFFWVLARASDSYGGAIIFSSYWWANNGWWLIPLILIGILIAFVVKGESEDERKKKFEASLLKNWLPFDYTHKGE